MGTGSQFFPQTFCSVFGCSHPKFLINFIPLFCKALESSVPYTQTCVTEHTDQTWTQLETLRSTTLSHNRGSSSDVNRRRYRRLKSTSNRSFLSQCSLTFLLQSSCFPTDESKVALVIMHLAGSAREWGTAMWDNKHECCSSYSNFSQELRKVFDRSALGNEAARALSLLRQGTRTVSDYAIEFRMLPLWTHLTTRERRHRIAHGLCLYVGRRAL